MKRWMTILLVIVLICSVVGCGKEKGEKWEWKIGKESNREFTDLLEMRLSENGATATGAEFVVCNHTQQRYCYGADFEMEVLKKGVWYKMITVPGLDATAEERSVDAKNIKLDSSSWPAKLPRGTYRLIKRMYPEGRREEAVFVYGEFSVK